MVEKLAGWGRVGRETTGVRVGIGPGEARPLNNVLRFTLRNAVLCFFQILPPHHKSLIILRFKYRTF